MCCNECAEDVVDCGAEEGWSWIFTDGQSKCPQKVCKEADGPTKDEYSDLHAVKGLVVRTVVRHPTGKPSQTFSYANEFSSQPPFTPSFKDIPKAPTAKREYHQFRHPKVS